MKNRNNNLISFGITLASSSRTEAANTDLEKRVLKVRRRNALPGKAKQVSTHDFNLPPPAKPFSPDMFNCEPRPLSAFPPPVKISPKVERVRKELEHSRTASYPSSGKSSSMAWAAAGEFFKVVCAGVFVFFKYAFIAIAVIITVSCMICAGRQPGGLR